MPEHVIACIPGDGIGPEVMEVAVRVTDAALARADGKITWREYDFGSALYRRTGRMMPLSGLEQLAQTDAILFGAVGDPELADHLTLWGLLIPIRRNFDQYVNLRPVKHLPGVRSPLSSPEGIDLIIVRENTEGEYSEVGGRFGVGTDSETALQESVFTRRGITRIAKYAAALARESGRPLFSATKSNGILHTMTFWDAVVAEVTSELGVPVRKVLIDALAAQLVLNPQRLGVVVCSNLFGDILSDIASACVGSIGLAASGNINPERVHPSMFEPVHGSAPDIAGQGVANPLGQVASAAMMLQHLGEAESANRLYRAIEQVVAVGDVTPDLGGSLSTREVGDRLLAYVR